MLFRQYPSSFFLLLNAIIITTFVLVYQLHNYDENNLIETFKTAYHQGTDALRVMNKGRIARNQILFPKGLQVDNLDEFMNNNPKKFNLTKLGNPNVLKAQNEDHTIYQINSKYSNHNLTIFDSSKNIDLDLKKCDTALKQEKRIEIDKPKNLDVSLTEILSKFLKEYKSNPYYKELSPFFINELSLQIKYNVVDRYWYRLAGSSVWLEQYGVHFMISRILYSPKGARNQPVLSLTYGQIFDKDWKELTNTKLVVPTNSLKKSMDDKQDEKQQFKLLQFPYFLPIPFWHDYDNAEGKYYGPEDPRVLLVKNKNGYNEPLVIFNAYHRKLVHFDDDEDDHIVMKTEFYRSMFMCWPWQFQRGKENTDGLPSHEYDKNYYNKVIELKIKNLPRQSKQKNWTPFISESSRSEDDYDRYINFIYRWANLEILKCDLINDSGICSFTYRLNDKLSPSAEIGPLRGGTQLVNINDLIKTQTELSILHILPPNREIWIGFARAHLDRCGCGNNMYRPNLVILVKDSVLIKQEPSLFGSDKESNKLKRDFYKISHISSSISFDIPIIGWNLMNPKDVCIGPNVLIPNGISSWSIKSLEKDLESGTWNSEDYTTLSLSMSDFTVHIINIKGLLNEVFNLVDQSLFLPIDETSDLHSNEVSTKKLKDPDPKFVNEPNRDKKKYLIGYNNDNVVCALQSSVSFCKMYGEKHQNSNQNSYSIYDTFEFEEFNENQNHEGSSDIDMYEQALEIQHQHEKINQMSKRPDSKSSNKQSSTTNHSVTAKSQNSKGKGNINSIKNKSAQNESTIAKSKSKNSSVSKSQNKTKNNAKGTKDQIKNNKTNSKPKPKPKNKDNNNKIPQNSKNNGDTAKSNDIKGNKGSVKSKISKENEKSPKASNIPTVKNNGSKNKDKPKSK